MQKDSGTVSGEGHVKESQTRHPLTDQGTLSHFEEWHPPHMKTGLRNRRIGKKVSFHFLSLPIFWTGDQEL